jgi:hypothetical protein
MVEKKYTKGDILSSSHEGFTRGILLVICIITIIVIICAIMQYNFGFFDAPKQQVFCYTGQEGNPAYSDGLTNSDVKIVQDMIHCYQNNGIPTIMYEN